MSAKIIIFAALATCVIALWAATPADAANKNPCMKGWTGPSKDNEIECEDANTIALDYGVIYNLIPLIIGILTLFPVCCIFICGRYCCQCLGGSKMRPASTCGECCCGNEAYDEMPDEDKINLYPMYSTILVKALTAACFVVCVIALILGILGGLETKNNSQSMVDAFGDGFQVFIDMANDLNESIRDPNNKSNVPAGFDASQFEDLKKDMESQRKDLTDQMQPVADGMETYALIPAFIIILPTMCLLAALVSAICNIRNILPLIIILSNFLLQFLFFFVASIILLALFPVNLLCDEVNAGPNEKGILNWMLIPQCENENPLKNLDEQVTKMEIDGSKEACANLLDICDTSTIWSASAQEKIFVCNITNSNLCTSFTTVSGTLEAMYFKTGASIHDNCSGISPCTVRNCSTSCTQPDTKKFAVDSLASIDSVTRILAAYNRIITPFLSCNKLFALVLNSGPKQGCDVILKGLNNFKNGLLMCGAACWFSIFVLFLGQKRFSCPDASKAPNPPSYESSSPIKSGDEEMRGRKNEPSSSAY